MVLKPATFSNCGDTYTLSTSDFPDGLNVAVLTPIPNSVRYLITSLEIVESTKVDLDNEHVALEVPVVARRNMITFMYSRVPNCLASRFRCKHLVWWLY